MKKAVVSGGAGFIASHLVEELVSAGYKVIIIDNFSTGREENIASIGEENIEVVRNDITEFDNILPYFKDAEYVFHLAALADIVPSIQNPLLYHRSNVDGTAVMLECARLSGAKKFIYAASSSCYGIPAAYPTSENEPINPQYPYALTKYIGEEYVKHWGRVYGLPYISLRLFNVFGPRSRTSGTYGAVFGVFLAQKLADKPFTVVGDGNQTRDFVFVKDVAKAFLAAAESGVKNEIMNVGTSKPVSVNKLASLLGGSKVHIPERPGEPRATHADIRKIKIMLGWSPSTAFEEGVKIMLDNIEYWRKAPVWTPDAINEATKEWFQYLKK